MCKRKEGEGNTAVPLVKTNTHSRLQARLLSSTTVYYVVDIHASLQCSPPPQPGRVGVGWGGQNGLALQDLDCMI